MLCLQSETRTALDMFVNDPSPSAERSVADTASSFCQRSKDFLTTATWVRVSPSRSQTKETRTVQGMPRGFSGPSGRTPGPFLAFAPPDALAYSAPRDTSDGSETRPGEEGTALPRHNGPGAGGGRAKEQAGPGGGRAPLPPAPPQGPPGAGGGGGRGEAGRPLARCPQEPGLDGAPQARPAPRPVRSGPSPCHPPWRGVGGGRGAASRRHRPPPSGQETAAAASGPAQQQAARGTQPIGRAMDERRGPPARRGRRLLPPQRIVGKGEGGRRWAEGAFGARRDGACPSPAPSEREAAVRDTCAAAGGFSSWSWCPAGFPQVEGPWGGLGPAEHHPVRRGRGAPPGRPSKHRCSVRCRPFLG